jgi:putative DNA primase/helicase
MDRLDMGLELLDHGFSVMPVRPNDKRPIAGFNWKYLQERQLEAEELEEMFEKVPEANLALITGSVSGIWVLDGMS